MQEIQTIADAATLKLLIIMFGGLVGFVNALIFFVLRGLKKSIDDLWTKQNKDHDIIKNIESQHRIFHKDQINSK